MRYAVKVASVSDAKALLDVYSPYILNTPVTFETEIPPVEDFAARIRSVQAAGFPYLMLTADDRIVGYVYAHRQAERAAYAWNAELSIYLDDRFTGKGIGRALYTLLIRLLDAQGYINQYADITGTNDGSIRFHKSLGFRQIGVHDHTGYKNNIWYDTVWLCRRTYEGVPGPILRFDELDPGQVASLFAECEQAMNRD